MAREKYLFKASDSDNEKDYQDLQTLTDKEIDQILTLVKERNNLSITRKQFPQIKQGILL